MSTILEQIAARLEAAKEFRPVRLEGQTAQQRRAADLMVRDARLDAVIECKLDLLKFATENGLDYTRLLRQFDLLPRAGK